MHGTAVTVKPAHVANHRLRYFRRSNAFWPRNEKGSQLAVLQRRNCKALLPSLKKGC